MAEELHELKNEVTRLRKEVDWLEKTVDWLAEDLEDRFAKKVHNGRRCRTWAARGVLGYLHGDKRSSRARQRRPPKPADNRIRPFYGW